MPKPAARKGPAEGPEGRFSRADLTVGFMFPISIMVGAAFGYYLDHWLDTFPWLSFVGFCFGVAAAIINLVRFVRRFDDDA